MGLLSWLIPVLVMVLLAVLGWTARLARRDGKLDALLEQLVSITGDHEARIRTLEQRRN